jgi:hypothetical protein
VGFIEPCKDPHEGSGAYKQVPREGELFEEIDCELIQKDYSFYPMFHLNMNLLGGQSDKRHLIRLRNIYRHHRFFVQLGEELHSHYVLLPKRVYWSFVDSDKGK